MSREVPADFLKPYNHTDKEGYIYKKWEESGYFNPDNLKNANKGSFCIIMPPPNANGSLHAGHALFVTIQDMLVRYARMNGKKALWLPGADHAGFETQVVYEKKLQKEGRSRFNMEKEDLYNEIFNFTLENKKIMEGQLRRLGASCDWTRSTFTLDEKVKIQTYETFNKLSEDKLLYRGLRTVNWCPKHQTGFSELELEYEERISPFYYLQYGPFVIGTVRPETKFGDKYVVMHPNDERYKEYKHGQKLELEWINGPITATIIKDENSDPEIGSGVMTITPWHSFIDYEIAKKHNLEFEQIIDNRGKLLEIAGEFQGMDIKDVRNKIIEKMKQKNLVVKIDDKYEHSVPKCYKCFREIEPQLKEQWFVSMKPLAEKAKKAIEDGDVEFITERYKKISLDWLSNIRDWNISRQIVWGIPIPAKICIKCKDGVVDLDDTKIECPKCKGKLEKDEDTFDTWFSSGQWPYIALDYPKGKDFKTYYPTSVMETGHDILFFWVLRMIMLGLYRTGKVPFKSIYLHGLVRDQKGQKMSKSKGNVVNPVDVIEEFGVDAMRMSYIVGNVPGENLNFSLDKIRGYKKFSNKLWNIARFVLSSTDEMVEEDVSNHHYISEFNNVAKDITKDMNESRYHLASEKIYHYVWHVFADKIIEESKDNLNNTTKNILMYIFINSMKLLHPFIPFVTESIWEHIPTNSQKTKDLLMIESWYQGK